MFYFLCEGDENKAEYSFIQRVIDEFHTDEVYELRAAGGSPNIASCFDDMLLEFKKGDTFILFFDNVERIKDVLVPEMLRSMEEDCNKRGVIFRYTTYYCFEELFLSYDGLPDMLPIKYFSCRSKLKNLQSHLYKKVDYRYYIDMEYWLELIPELRGAVTREQFSSVLLSELTTMMKGEFRVIKKYVGSCWMYDCDVLRMKKNNIGRRCAVCKYDCKDCLFRDKLSSLDNNSVSNLSMPFSTIFYQ